MLNPYIRPHYYLLHIGSSIFNTCLFFIVKYNPAWFRLRPEKCGSVESIFQDINYLKTFKKKISSSSTQEETTGRYPPPHSGVVGGGGDKPK